MLIYLAWDTNIALSSLEIVDCNILKLNPSPLWSHNLDFFIISTFFALDHRFTLTFRCSHPSDWAAAAPQTFPPDQCFRPLSFLYGCLLTGLGSTTWAGLTHTASASVSHLILLHVRHITSHLSYSTQFAVIRCKKWCYIQSMGGRITRPPKSILSRLFTALYRVSPLPQYV